MFVVHMVLVLDQSLVYIHRRSLNMGNCDMYLCSYDEERNGVEISKQQKLSQIDKCSLDSFQWLTIENNPRSKWKENGTPSMFHSSGRSIFFLVCVSSRIVLFKCRCIDCVAGYAAFIVDHEISDLNTKQIIINRIRVRHSLHLLHIDVSLISSSFSAGCWHFWGG